MLIAAQFYSSDQYWYVKKWLTSASTDIDTDISCIPSSKVLIRVSLTMSCTSEKLEGEKLNVAEVTQSEIAQKQKLQTVLERINDSLKLSTRSIRWNVDCKDSA